MDMMEAIYSRKSVRAYTGEKISQATLEEILKAGMAAPVGMARYETLHLTVIEDGAVLQAIDEGAAKMFGKPEAHPLYGAPTLVLASVKPGGDAPNNSELSNAAIMVHNMSMAAVALGVGNCLIWGAITALNQNPQLVAKLQLPQGFVPCCGVILGATGERYEKRDVPADRVNVSYLR